MGSRNVAGPRSYLSSPVEVIDFGVVVLSIANAASGKLLDLNMIRMVRCVRVHSIHCRRGSSYILSCWEFCCWPLRSPYMLPGQMLPGLKVMQQAFA